MIIWLGLGLLEPYTKEESPIEIFMLNSSNNFEKSTCITLEELRDYFSTGLDTKTPSMLMAIFTSPDDRNLTGYGSRATGKLVVKIPPNNMYVTLGSIQRVLDTKNLKKWYAMPLYNGKRRRLGNLDEAFLQSSNHGQIPGFIVYKLYTADEIMGGVTVKETSTDYPTLFLHNETKILYDIMGGDVTISFVNSIINQMIS